MQLILALFCVMIGGTLVFMKKSSIIDLLVSERWDKYRNNQKYFDQYISFIRIFASFIFAIGFYILGNYLFYFWYGA